MTIPVATNPLSLFCPSLAAVKIYTTVISLYSLALSPHSIIVATSLSSEALAQRITLWLKSNIMAQRLFLEIVEVKSFHFHFSYKLYKLLLKNKKEKEPNIFLTSDFMLLLSKIKKGKKKVISSKALIFNFKSTKKKYASAPARHIFGFCLSSSLFGALCILEDLISNNVEDTIIGLCFYFVFHINWCFFFSLWVTNGMANRLMT